MNLEFSNWLKSSKSFTDRSARNVVSRLKRASSLCKFDWDADVARNLFHLEQVPAFQKLTVSVKSQLRRAVKLNVEFLNSSH